MTMPPDLLHHLLEVSAPRQRAAVAVRDGERTLTYQELEATANQLAHRLQRHGVARGARIGLYLEKSRAAVTAIWGILKAGAAYVPLDPSAPVQRVAFMIADCQMHGLVTTQARLTRLQPALGTPLPWVLLIDQEESWRTTPSTAPPDPHLGTDDLAYILYTSGSTGNPKGVMISHRAALTFVNWATAYFQLQPHDRVASHAPLHFDLSIFDLFTPIAAGATVVLVPPAVALFPRNLADWIAAQEITVWYSVPSALTRLVLYGGLERHAFASLSRVLFAGEVFPIKYLRQLMDAIPHAAYYNLYGPTETNVCTVYPVPMLAPERTAPCPIGQACANSHVFALNNRHQLLQPGEIGELYVHGPSVMQGYWGLTEKTQEVLVPHPLDPERWTRVYRTGDLVEIDATGNYTFVGRHDTMIKSRGYRIELGEIEAVLYRHVDVAEAVVIALPDAEVGNVLKAFVVVHHGRQLHRSALARFCATYLPSYMIPEDFAFCAALPKTSTGKLDRTALRG